ncbi:MAG: hypothetical protein RL375_4237, partial [Pseudomonadota bacterium]
MHDLPEPAAETTSPGVTATPTAPKAVGLPLRVFMARLIGWCLGPLLLVSAYLAIDRVRLIDSQRTTEARQLVDSARALLDHELRVRVAALTVLAASPLADDAAPRAEFHREAQAYARRFGGEVELVDADRRLLLSTRVPAGTPLPASPHPAGLGAAAAAVAAGRPTVADLQHDPGSDDARLAVAVPVARPDRPTQALVSSFAPSDVHALIDQLALPSGWTLQVLDGQGAVMARRGEAVGGAASDAQGAAPVEARSTLSTWSVQLGTSAPGRHPSLWLAGAVLGAAIVAATLAGVLGGTAATRRLARMVAGLSQPHPDGVPPPGIREIAEVQARLDDAARQRARAAVDLSASEARFRRLFDEAPIPLTLIGSQGQVVGTNTSFERLFGYTATEIPTVAEWWAQAYPDPVYRAEVMQAWNAAFQNALATGQRIEPAEWRVTCRSGAERTMVISGIQVQDDFLCVFFDITERKQAEQALQASQAAALEARRQALALMEQAQEARLRAEAINATLRELSLAVEQSPVSIVITDLNARIHYVNEAFVRVSGYERDEVIGRNPRVLQS